MGRGRDQGGGADLREAFSCSGILKILEVIISFTIVMIHRLGAGGSYLFFSNPYGQLQNNDQTRALDRENLGNGACVTFLIIPLVLLSSYVLDGRYEIQKTFLEWVWNLIGCAMYLGAGIKTVQVWTAYEADEAALSNGLYNDYTENAFAMGKAMGGLCLLNSLVFFVDFIMAYITKRRIKNSQEAY